MTVHDIRHLKLPDAVLNVLRRIADPSIEEIAHEVESNGGGRHDLQALLGAICILENRGYYIVEHDDLDGIRYELVEPELSA
ncbi:hypothetical protein C7446_2542 [Kushneria sinocarnis]|uniref:ArsR family transcriptional regulator n=1 Tax=Kushneria sinocarnis TaxID=595502 RepID=A0A420WUL0_9GAMM|nr:hypothetical protein [Kushneria sinocarnis]RKQ97123.1 hypothetical protein C7446_2542 [Kushneria sinocarnis]